MKVTKNGLEVKGQVTATSGNFSNCTIDETCTIKGKLTASTICDNSDSYIASGSINFIGSESYSLAQYNMRIVDNADESRKAYVALSDSSGIMEAAIKCTYSYTTNGINFYSTSGISSTDQLCSITGFLIQLSTPRTGGDTIQFSASSVKSNVSVTVTSDRNAKHSITDISEKYSVLFDELRPRLYKYNDGTSERLHTGFIAQEVDDAIVSAGLTREQFAALCISDKDTEDELWGLRYEEFVAILTYEIQKLKTRVIELESHIEKEN